ncbi:hypothetical protein, partial [Xylanibacter muris]|uniref:hypothetical protein n=1 Tax=Xylanibacter muris TaxID=2736290 RepID=UPI0025A18B2F
RMWTSSIIYQTLRLSASSPIANAKSQRVVGSNHNSPPPDKICGTITAGYPQRETDPMIITKK